MSLNRLTLSVFATLFSVVSDAAVPIAYRAWNGCGTLNRCCMRFSYAGFVSLGIAVKPGTRATWARQSPWERSGTRRAGSGPALRDVWFRG